MEYLHQLSARLLGWRRSCDPPAIELEPPAEKQPVTVLRNACCPPTARKNKNKQTKNSLRANLACAGLVRAKGRIK